MIHPRMELSCKQCQKLWPRNAAIEAVHLHMNVEHDTNAIDLELVAVCDCGAVMKWAGADANRPTGGGWWLMYSCPACGLQGRIRQNHEGIA